MFNWVTNPVCTAPPLWCSLYEQRRAARYLQGLGKGTKHQPQKKTPQTQNTLLHFPCKRWEDLGAAPQMFCFPSTLRATCCTIQFLTLQEGPTAMSYLGEYLPPYSHAWTGGSVIWFQSPLLAASSVRDTSPSTSLESQVSKAPFQAAQSAVGRALRMETWYKNLFSKSKPAPSLGQGNYERCPLRPLLMADTSP